MTASFLLFIICVFYEQENLIYRIGNPDCPGY